VGELQPRETAQEVVCPHCRRPFVGELMDGSAARYRGFKCPHCRLFVPHERAEEPEPEPAEATKPS
jgi:DNA-directed RNA polymerase subunit RPC12/RpoP